MNDDFRNKDIKYDDINEATETTEKLPGNLTARKIKVLRISGLIFILSACFFLSFYFSSKIINNKNIDNSNNSNTAQSNSDVLDLDSKLVLKNGSEESVYTIAEYKEAQDIDYDLTQDALEKKLESQGYELSKKSDNQITFIKDANYVEGRYYIGLSNGYMALFQAETNSKLKLISEYKNETPEKFLPQSVKEELQKYKYSCDTPQEAETIISQFR